MDGEATPRGRSAELPFCNVYASSKAQRCTGPAIERLASQVTCVSIGNRPQMPLLDSLRQRVRAEKADVEGARPGCGDAAARGRIHERLALASCPERHCSECAAEVELQNHCMRA